MAAKKKKKKPCKKTTRGKKNSTMISKFPRSLYICLPYCQPEELGEGITGFYTYQGRLNILSSKVVTGQNFLVSLQGTLETGTDNGSCSHNLPFHMWSQLPDYDKHPPMMGMTAVFSNVFYLLWTHMFLLNEISPCFICITHTYTHTYTDM